MDCGLWIVVLWCCGAVVLWCCGAVLCYGWVQEAQKRGGERGLMYCMCTHGVVVPRLRLSRACDLDRVFECHNDVSLQLARQLGP